MNLTDLQTPALVLDRTKLKRNIDRMRFALNGSGVRLRPHMKTAKSIDVARLVLGDAGGAITVSTLREAEYFLDHGISDLLYAVGIAPNKLPRVAELLKRGANVHIILDSLEAAQRVAMQGESLGVMFSVLIELDCDGHRSGLRPDDPMLLEIGNSLERAPATRLSGVLTHAGESYTCKTTDCIVEMAEQERTAAIDAAERMRAAGLPCPIVSVGSSPTAALGQCRTGLTEVRAGVYMFQDLFQSNLGVCTAGDVALSVLGTVIGHKRANNCVIVDAGALAMSKDRGTSRQRVDYGYGVVCDTASGNLIDDYLVTDVNQEHGLISRREGAVNFSRFPIGSQVRVLPNHACMTAAQYEQYHVTDGDTTIVATWPRINGW